MKINLQQIDQESFKLIQEEHFGYSWTLSKVKAEWFAKRLGDDDPILLCGTCEKTKVIAYFDGRNEKEVFINPRDVYQEEEL